MLLLLLILILFFGVGGPTFIGPRLGSPVYGYGFGGFGFILLIVLLVLIFSGGSHYRWGW